jgi:pantoate--beta-alanine ligase
MTDVLRTTAEVRARLSDLRRSGETLALVPTMGYLHEGHLSLMREGRRRASVCAATLFVNPTQFGPQEDLASYPRDEAGDVSKCASVGVGFVFVPPVEEVYPQGFQTFVEVTEVSRGLCGASRPVHFRGVATVVTKLLALFRPDVALFGEKDYQQLQVIRSLNRDLELGVEIAGMPIVREPDGLAMSSRNAYLSASERTRALSLSRALSAARTLFRSGETDVERLLLAARAELEAAGAREDYLKVVHPATLCSLERAEGSSRVLVAAFVGKTRLIDNAALEEA